MRTYLEIKQEQEDKHTALFKECKLFWAFNNNQFDENKTPLRAGERYIHIGSGGYMPKGYLESFNKGLDEINAWFKKETKKCREEHILYELNNHECYYAGSIEGAWNVLKSYYTLKQVQKVYKEGLAAWYACNEN